MRNRSGHLWIAVVMIVGQTPSAMTHEPIARPSSTGRRTTNDDRFGSLWRSGCDVCWSDSDCDDPQAHCAAQGDAVWDVGRLGPVCLLGDVKRREGALPTVGLQVRNFNPSRHQHASA